MLPNPSVKYRPFPPVDLPERSWPNRTITASPAWCSVDLRDGNQALIEPMDGLRKRKLYDQLVKIGFKEIDVGFPSASQTDFAFVRELIERDLIPNDLTIAVLTPARLDLIARTFESLRGVPRATVHLYNSTSPSQRRVVFRMSRDEVRDLAVEAAKCIRQHADAHPETHWTFQYSPESFTGTELDFALEISDAVVRAWSPTPDHKMILNLPSTVELATPNVYADQIEWMNLRLQRRDSLILSIHPHNDRGCAVAAAELAMLAGAERVEGTLFGNGERTGNVDIVTLALNLYTQGIDPRLDFSQINEVARCAEECNQLPIHPRHPYVGDLVFTAFSGSHQDAIKKGLAARDTTGGWDIPYLPIDPADVGRTYQSVIRVNSQSGKGGISYLLERDHGVVIPRRMQIEFSQVVQRTADMTGKELGSEEIWRLFKGEYLPESAVLIYRTHQLAPAGSGGEAELSADLTLHGKSLRIRGRGTGPIDALIKGLGLPVDVVAFEEHSRGAGSAAEAVAIVELTSASNPSVFGVGLHKDILVASLCAVLAAINRAALQGGVELGSLRVSSEPPAPLVRARA